jgi:hypothetical protein
VVKVERLHESFLTASPRAFVYIEIKKGLRDTAEGLVSALQDLTALDDIQSVLETHEKDVPRGSPRASMGAYDILHETFIDFLDVGIEVASGKIGRFWVDANLWDIREVQKVTLLLEVVSDFVNVSGESLAGSLLVGVLSEDLTNESPH